MWQFVIMPETQVLLQNLTKARMYGYKPLWESDTDLAYSFRIGSYCPKYHRLLDWIEGTLKINCSPNEMDMMLRELQLIRGSAIMRPIEGVGENPMKFRLTTVNLALSCLFQKIQNTANAIARWKENELNIRRVDSGASKRNDENSGVFSEVIYFNLTCF